MGGKNILSCIDQSFVPFGRILRPIQGGGNAKAIVLRHKPTGDVTVKICRVIKV